MTHPSDRERRHVATDIQAGSVADWHTRVMPKVNAEWDTQAGRSIREVDGPAEALALCDGIEAGGADHVLVSFTTVDGAFFAIGLGAPQSCAVYWESVDPPYYQSRGTAGVDGDTVTFWYGGQPSEMPVSVTITCDDARAALEQFLITGRRPENLAWDET